MKVDDDALLLHPPADEVKVRLAVLHAVLPRAMRAAEPIVEVREVVVECRRIDVAAGIVGVDDLIVPDDHDLIQRLGSIDEDLDGTTQDCTVESNNPACQNGKQTCEVGSGFGECVPGNTAPTT